MRRTMRPSVAIILTGLAAAAFVATPMAQTARRDAAVSVEEVIGAVAAHPGLEHLEVLRVGSDVGERHLMSAEGPLDR